MKKTLNAENEERAEYPIAQPVKTRAFLREIHKKISAHSAHSALNVSTKTFLQQSH
jgi:hypothetical protein